MRPRRMQPVVRLSIQVDMEVSDLLKRLVQRNGETISDVVRRAVRKLAQEEL
jgi:Arc/MetJ-type ribon-helix-helix transcriptional regulator